MNMSTRRGRRIIRYRRRGYQVLATVPKIEGFQLLYWVPAKHGRKPRGMQR